MLGKIVTSRDGLLEILEWAIRSPERVIDLETTGTDWVWDDITGIAINLPRVDRQYYIPIGHEVGENCPWEYVQRLFPSLVDNAIVINHHLKFDRLMMQKAGLWLSPRENRCTMMAMQLYNENEDNFRLKSVCDRYGIGTGSLEENILYEKLASMGYKNKNWKSFMRKLPPEDVAPYAIEDVRLAWGLDRFVMPRLEAMGMLDLYRKDMKYWEIVCRAEYRGLHLDRELCEQRVDECSYHMNHLENMLCSALNVDSFNPNSYVQVRNALGVESTKKEDLMMMENPVAQMVVEWREWAKARNSYYSKFLEYADKDDFLHCTLWADGTVTGRMRASRPNLMAMPRASKVHREKDVFVAPKGKVYIFGDWSQMELRVGAHFAKEYKMIEAFANGEDIHGTTAKLVHGRVTPETRNGNTGGKRCNFAIVYGTGAQGFAKTTKLPIKQCRRILSRLHSAYPGFKLLYNKAEQVAKMRGYIKYYSGRFRRFNDKGSCYKAMNHLIQGTVAQMCRDSMVRIFDEICQQYPEVYMPLQIHDEIILESPLEFVNEITPRMKEIMEDWEYIGEEVIRTPIVADMQVGESWGGKVDFDKWTRE